MSGTPHTHRHAAAAGGFTLVEMALVLLIVGLLAAVFLPATNTLLDNNRRKETRAKLEALEQAMVRFVMVNRRLPCPANGTLGTGSAQSGVELRTVGPPATCDAMQAGVVPWRSLGVSADAAIDAWGNLITYRVWASYPGNTIATSLAMDAGMDFSACDPAKTTAPTAPNYLCDATNKKPLEVLTAGGTHSARGFRVCRNVPCTATIVTSAPGINEVARRVDGNGAAFFLISHGANKVGAYTTGGTPINTANGPGPGARETINQNGLALRAASLDEAFYIDAELDESPADYYDDIVLRPTVMAVAMAAGLAPRKP